MVQHSSGSAWSELRTRQIPSCMEGKQDAVILLAVKQPSRQAGRSRRAFSSRGRMRALSIGLVQWLQNERRARCNAGSGDLTNRNGPGAPETSSTCSATSTHHSSVPSVPCCPAVALPAHGTCANAGTPAASGDRQAAVGQPQSSFPAVPMSTPGQSDPEPPGCLSCPVLQAGTPTHCPVSTATMAITRSNSSCVQALWLFRIELTRCLISSARVSSVPQARLLHPRPGQVRLARPANSQTRPIPASHGPLSTMRCPQGCRDRHGFIGEFGPLHNQEIVGHIVLAAIPLSISATAPCPASRTPGPHRVLATTLPRPSPARVSPQRETRADFVFVQSSIPPTLISSDVTGIPSGPGKHYRPLRNTRTSSPRLGLFGWPPILFPVPIRNLRDLSVPEKEQNKNRRMQCRGRWSCYRSAYGAEGGIIP